jgi:hypothetical protein
MMNDDLSRVIEVVFCVVVVAVAILSSHLFRFLLSICVPVKIHRQYQNKTETVYVPNGSRLTTQY